MQAQTLAYIDALGAGSHRVMPDSVGAPPLGRSESGEGAGGPLRTSWKKQGVKKGEVSMVLPRILEGHAMIRSKTGTIALAKNRTRSDLDVSEDTLGGALIMGR